ILSQSKGLRHFHCHLLLIGGKEDKDELKSIKHETQKFISTIHTVNEQVNSILQHFINDAAAVKNLFNIEYIIDPGDGLLTGQVQKIQNFVDDVEIKYKRSLVSEKVADMTPIDNNAHHAATVLFRFEELTLFEDTTIRNIADKLDEFSEYKIRHFYIIGYFTNRIKNFILKKIEMGVGQDISEHLNIKKDEKITIELSDETIIDGSIADALYNFLAKTVRTYNFQVNVSENNMKKLNNSPNYDKLQKYIIKNL
ncbi:MAG: hypothetical protein KAS39_01020, partial [Actinomycetia bacterium]|nr:hypothetical protein [Actinomycetes bacterium]